MTNLVKVVAQLRKQREEAQKTVETTGPSVGSAWQRRRITIAAGVALRKSEERAELCRPPPGRELHLFWQYGDGSDRCAFCFEI
jgi:hypothetical protein